jgi:hypothetical protein
MISSEVQRTLVKSPPELWTELSDPASLARHLGEFGAIRITRLEPEKSIDWEGETAAGTVLIKPSGWGTRVTLRATRATPAAQHEPPAGEALSPAPPAPAAAIEPGAEAEDAPALEDVAAAQLEPDGEAVTSTQLEPEGEAVTSAQLEPDGEAPAPEPFAEHQDPPRRNEGFFARLFRRARRTEVSERTLTPDPAEELEREPLASAYFEPLHDEDPAQAESEAPTPSVIAPAIAPSEPDAAAQGEPPELSMGAEAQPAPEGSEGSAQPPPADLSAAEESASEQVTEVLTSMLDRLGTAHRRPFSRA